MNMQERQEQQEQEREQQPPTCAQEKQLLQQEESLSATVTTQPQQRQPYEELKWTEAPLYFDPTTISMLTSTASDVTCVGCHDYTDNSGEPASSAAAAAMTMTAAPAPRLPLHGETTALLIVDVQPEYWSHCPSVQQDFPDFPAHMALTLQTCRARHAKIIWVRADYRMAHSPWLVQFERLRGKMPGYMVEVPCDYTSTTTKDASNCSWEDFATPRGGEVIIPKTSWSSTSDTALKQVLRSNGIDTVLVCGLITSVCVQHSAFGVFEAGYRTLLVTDACADRGRARHEAALALYGEYMYELVTSDDLQHPTTGLLPAKPVWLTLDSIRPMNFIHHHPNNNQNSNAGAGGAGGESSSSYGGRLNSNTRSSSCAGGGGGGIIVSPLGSFGDLQNALLMADKNTKGSSGDTTLTAPSSETTASSSSETSSVQLCL